jgi:hypothetical protein
MQNRWGERRSRRSPAKADPREPKLKFQNGSSAASPHHWSWKLIHQFAGLGHRDALAGSGDQKSILPAQGRFVRRFFQSRQKKLARSGRFRVKSVAGTSRFGQCHPSSGIGGNNHGVGIIHNKRLGRRLPQFRACTGGLTEYKQLISN